MRLKIKNSLPLASFLILIFIGLFLPVHQTHAIVPLVGAGIAAAVVYVGGWVLQALSLLSAAGVTMWAAVLQWTMGLDWSYTSGGIVDIGWPIVRDLANIFFVIALVAIGLATALRIEGYQVKKTLPTLVAIILLINFTPVIAGLIVDASNVVMNFFIQGLDPGSYMNAHMSAIRSVRPPSIWEALNPFKEIGMLLGTLIIIAVDFIVQFIFMVFALLFLVRYIAIWILVILSPIAFASYILPATRSTWKLWWSQFLQWCIIGATTGFFLYLGTMLLSKLDEIIPLPSTQGGESLDPTNILISLMPLITVAIFYCIGLFVSLSTSAMGAKGIISSMKKGGKAAENVMRTTAWKAGVTGPIKGIKTYYEAKRMGFSKRDAFGEMNREMKRAILPKPPTATSDASWGKTIAKGSLNAVRNTAKAGWDATWGIKAKKTGKKQCPNCKKMIAANAKMCPTTGCGYSFE